MMILVIAVGIAAPAQSPLLPSQMDTTRPLCPVMPTNVPSDEACGAEWSTDDRLLALKLKHRLLTSVAAATRGKRLLLTDPLERDLVHVHATPEIREAGYSLERAWTDGPGRSAPLLVHVYGSPATEHPNSSCFALEAVSREPDVPVVLVTLGWDTHADPLSTMQLAATQLGPSPCARKLIELPQVIMRE